MKILKIQFQKYENIEIHRIIFVIKNIMICLSITLQNYKNYEIQKNPCQNQEKQ